MPMHRRHTFMIIVSVLDVMSKRKLLVRVQSTDSTLFKKPSVRDIMIYKLKKVT